MAGKIARRDFHIMVDGELLHYYAGDEVEPEIVALIDNKSIFDGEEHFSPGNPDHEEPVSPQQNSRFRRQGASSGYASMSVKDLIAWAKDHGVELPSHAKKADLIRALDAADLAPPE